MIIVTDLSRRAQRIQDNAMALLQSLRTISPLDDDLEEEPIDTLEPEKEAYNLPLVFQITYRDSKGRESQRLIQVIRIEAHNQDYRVHAYCMQRGAYRQFLYSRISEAVDMITGEVFEDVAEFFRQAGIFESFSPETLALQKRLDHVVILTYAGAVDGNFLPVENDEIIKHVVNGWDDLLDEGRLRNRMKALAPSEKDYEMALSRVARQSATEKKELLRAFKAVVDADGVLHADEESLAHQILAVLA